MVNLNQNNKIEMSQIIKDKFFIFHVQKKCIAVEQHPLYLMIPATMSCSYAFRFPVGTPPNAIAASAGKMDIKSMLVGGCPPAVYSLINLTILFPTWGVYVYDIKGFPDWARNVNSSKTTQCD